MGRTAEKIAHLESTASSNPEYREVLRPFREIFAYVEGREGATGIRFTVPEGNGAERIRGGLPLLSPESLSVDPPAAAKFLSGLLDVLRAVGKEGGEALDRLGRAVADGELDLAALYAACLARKRDVVEAAAKALGIPGPLLVFVLEIPLKTDLEGVAEGFDPSRFEGWKEGYCPACGSRAGMDELSGEEGRRHLSCSSCFFR